MTEPKAVPDEIAHLDFDPAPEGKEDFSRLKECVARIRNSKDICPRPAVWRGTFRCCMATLDCCDQHKKMGDVIQWYCRHCKRIRSAEWMGWTRL